MANGSVLPPGINPLPNIALQRLMPRFTALGQGGIGQRLGGLLSGANPLFNLGIGLLAASGPRPQGTANFGSRLGEAMQFASQRELAAAQNELLRQSMLAQQQRQQALARLPGLLSQTTVAQGPSTQVTGIGGEELGTIPGRQAVVPLMATPQGQQQLMGLLGQIAPEKFAEGLLAQAMPQTDAFGRKIQTVQSLLGRPLTESEVLKLAGGGTTINIGDKLNEPIPISSIDSVRLPDGSPVPIGTTFAEARDMGARVQSADEQKKSAQADAALGILSELETLAIGPEGIFTQVAPGVANRVASALSFAFDLIDQNDPRAARFRDLSTSTISPFVKFLGETGALAEGDVERALGLLPRIFPIPDTGEVAKEKLRTLREIIERGVRQLNEGVTVAPQSEPQPQAPSSPTRRFRFNPQTGQLEPAQ